MESRSLVAGVIITLAVASLIGYVFFVGDTTTLDPRPDTITEAEDLPSATVTRSMPAYATSGSTIIVTLEIDAEEPVNTSVREQLQLDDTTVWHNTTLRNVQQDTIWYSVTLPNETGTMDLSGLFAGIDETVEGPTTINIVTRDPLPYEPPAIDELVPAELGTFERTSFHSDGSSETAEQYAEAAYANNSEEYTVELWQYTGSAAANASMVDWAEPDGEQIPFYDGQTPAYRTADTLLWVKGPFLYIVDDPNAEELAFALIEVNE